jgi:hypothetical protein
MPVAAPAARVRRIARRLRWKEGCMKTSPCF